MQQASGEAYSRDGSDGSRPAVRAAEGAIESAAPMMRAVEAAAMQVASSNVSVLIEGETGVGKEWLARRIHEASPRSGAPFVAVNCGALPEQLVESLLFGHEKGAFTGATERYRGKFREADGGTLFLDEIGELPPAAQVKVLRALQEGAVEPVGGTGQVAVDVRIVSATNRDLAAEVREGRFRADLYYRLAVFPLTVPALRDRAEDIEALARALLERIAEREDAAAPSIAPSALLRLRYGEWPGNVRELENVLTRAFVLSGGGEIGAEHLGMAPRGDAGAIAAPSLEMPESQPRPHGGGGEAIQPFAPTGEIRTLAEIEREMIVLGLRACNGSMSGTARRLGIGRSTLYRKLREFGLESGMEAATAA